MPPLSWRLLLVNMRNKSYVAILLALAVAIVMMYCLRSSKHFYAHEGVVWTTDYHITYEADRDLGDSIQLILNNLDMSVSPYNKASLISSLNENTSTRVDTYIKRLIEASRIVHHESNGAFDPTVMPLVNAWGFGYKSGALPTRAQLDSILHFVGMDKLALHGDTPLHSMVTHISETQRDAVGGVHLQLVAAIKIGCGALRRSDKADGGILQRLAGQRVAHRAFHHSLRLDGQRQQQEGQICHQFFHDKNNNERPLLLYH